MRRLFLASALILLLTGVYGYTSTTVPIQADSPQQQACNGLDVGEVDYSTSVEDKVLDFEGVYCAPNIGYTLESSDISIEGNQISASAFISRPEGITGPAVTAVRFNESKALEPGEYNLEISVEVEDKHDISESSEIVVEGESKSLMQRIKAFFSGLFE